MKFKKSARRPSYRDLYKQAIGASVSSTKKAWGKARKDLDSATRQTEEVKAEKVGRQRKEDRALDVRLRGYSYR